MRILNALTLAAVLAVPLAASVSTMARADDARITVTGEGSVQVAPDIATITLGVTTQGETAAAALQANNAALAAVLERLKTVGVADRDVQTSNLSVNPNWVGYDSGRAPTIAGYTAQNLVTVTVRKLEDLGSVLDSAVADGANTLNGLSFGLANPKPVMDEARKLAVADALDRARLLSGAAGVGLGDVVSISENGGYQPPMPMLRAEAKADSVPVATGELGISASVTLVLELEQGR